MNKTKEQPQSRIKSVWGKPSDVKEVPQVQAAEPIEVELPKTVEAPKVVETVKVKMPENAPTMKMVRVTYELDSGTVYAVDDLLLKMRRATGWNVSRSDFFRAFSQACAEKEPTIAQCRNYMELVQLFKAMIK